MGFQQGLSGLNGAAKALEAIGNNISNANTVGFKQSAPEFADVFASSLASAGSSSQVGIGTTVSAITQEFSQGNITATSNPLDIAINGAGFFRMMDTTGAPSYSREGQFQVNKDGFLVNSAGLRLSGTMPATGSTPVPIFIDTSNMAPRVTGGATPPVGLVMGLNLDSREAVPVNAMDNALVPPAPKFAPGNAATYAIPSDPTTYNKSTSATVYDSLGNAHQLGMYFVKGASTTFTDPITGVTSPAQTWQVYVNADNGTNTPEAANANGVDLMDPFIFTFNSSGKLVASTDMNGTATTTLGVIPVALTPGVTNPPVSTALPLSFNLNLAATTQYGNIFGVNSITQDGFTSAQLSGLSVSADGVVSGRYSNGQSKELAQITLTTFKNPNALVSLGGNQWAETGASGQPQIGNPGAGSNGVLQASAIEESNVDLTKQLVDMITQQRTYQANAQTIKTEDQILQTLVSMR